MSDMKLVRPSATLVGRMRWDPDVIRHNSGNVTVTMAFDSVTLLGELPGKDCRCELLVVDVSPEPSALNEPMDERVQG